MKKGKKSKHVSALPWRSLGHLVFEVISPAIGQESLQGSRAALLQELVGTLAFWDCGDFQLQTQGLMLSTLDMKACGFPWN